MTTIMGMGADFAEIDIEAWQGSIRGRVVMTTEMWDRHDIAGFLELRPGSVNKWLARHEIAPASLGRSDRGGLVNLYLADDIRAAARNAPGQGFRSDLEEGTA